ncbi:TonB-dependent receptor plug domain-containing protein [Caulobacter segnis]
MGGDLDACRGQAPALTGRRSASAALDSILAGSGRDYRQPDPRTVIIHRPNAAPSRLGCGRPRKLRRQAIGLGGVVITAQRRYPNLPGRTPYAISVVSTDGLERRALTSVNDLTGQVAGMTVTNLGPGRDKVLLRGLSDGAFTGQAQSMVALYLDDVPITYSAPDPNLRLADVERVEILARPARHPLWRRLFGRGDTDRNPQARPRPLFRQRAHRGWLHPGRRTRQRASRGGGQPAADPWPGGAADVGLPRGPGRL